jgi:N-acetylmuramoyl-L-alanine amidase
MKRILLCGLLAAFALSCPAFAYRPQVPVQVDGRRIADGYIEQGSAYVSLRALLSAIGSWDIQWDNIGKEASARSGGRSLTASPNENRITVDGHSYSGTVTLKGGTTYIPLRLTAELLGNSVVWDPYLDGAAVTTAGSPYDASALYWLSRVIYAESGAESITGQIAVGNVVLNRVSSPDFPASIPSVIFDRKNGVQFEPVSNGSIYKTPSETSIEAAKQALAGQRPVGDALYFYAPALSPGTWITANRIYLTTIGCHRFYL